MEGSPDDAIPRRPLALSLLPNSVSMVGLGCSSFSTFFWSNSSEHSNETITVENLMKDHPVVQEWIKTIDYAIEAGVTLLDTAPWYGHGTSEAVIGWALEQLPKEQRKCLIINTKVGRYEADPAKQFDFSGSMTLQSAERSLKRMKCEYIDVLQLHDPEFAPSLDLLMKETIPAMIQCQEKGWCRALGMTGYPLQVQHQILERSREVFGRNIWDQALTYGHYNLHDMGLLRQPIGGHDSFADYCRHHNIQLLAAAPLSMGLLTNQGPPEWHPASSGLKEACRKAAAICRERSVDIATLALVVAFATPRIPCTILGLKDVQQVRTVQTIAQRFRNVSATDPNEILNAVLENNEREAWMILKDVDRGPFADVWKSGAFCWDGVQEARSFWRELGQAVDEWQAPLPE